MSAIGCPNDDGTYTLVEVLPDPDGAGFLPTGRIFSDNATLLEARQPGVHIVLADDERCVVEPTSAPTDEEALACPTDETFDLYDAVSGEHLASGVAEADLPESVEIVADDDPRCGPSIKPAPAPEELPVDGAPPPTGGIPTGGLPGQLPGAPLPTSTSPFGAPGAVAPAPGTSPAAAFQPGCDRAPINLQRLPLETRAPGPGTWQNQWNS